MGDSNWSDFTKCGLEKKDQQIYVTGIILHKGVKK